MQLGDPGVPPGVSNDRSDDRRELSAHLREIGSPVEAGLLAMLTLDRSTTLPLGSCCRVRRRSLVELPPPSGEAHVRQRRSELVEEFRNQAFTGSFTKRHPAYGIDDEVIQVGPTRQRADAGRTTSRAGPTSRALTDVEVLERAAAKVRGGSRPRLRRTVMPDPMHFPFSDTIAGRVTTAGPDGFTLRTIDGRDFDVSDTSASMPAG